MGASFVPPPRWSPELLDRDIAAAVEAFRLERFDEPLEQYHAHLDECLGTVEDLIELTVDLAELRERAGEVVAEARYIEAIRFLAGPFISVDDLRVIAQTSLAPTALRADHESAARVVETVLAGLDRRRFPWVGEARDPHEDEKSAAALATASLMATERVRTLRRTEARVVQESAVADALRQAGFREVGAPRVIRTLEEAPGPGEFCTERTFGDRKADLVVGLWDRRRMPLECKASNSATNSYKRVNHEAASKAETWLQDFGRSQVVPAAVLSGVFKRANLEDAQARGLTLLWAHRLDDMLSWISSTRAGA
jgi:XamI restriction endonuclease